MIPTLTVWASAPDAVKAVMAIAAAMSFRVFMIVLPCSASNGIARRVAREHAHIELPVDIPAGLDDRDALAGHALLLLQQGRECRGAGAFREVMRVREEMAHSGADLRLAHADDALGALANQGERVGI